MQDKPIRVLHMIGCFEAGGSQAMVINLLRAIDRTKVQFDFIVDNPERMEWAPQAEELGAEIYVMPKFRGNNGAEVRRAWNRFFGEHPEYKVLHSHVRSYASIYLPIAKKHGVKTIVQSHSTSNGSGFASVVKRCLQFPLRYQADCFFGCSKEAGQWLFGKKVVEGSRYYMLKNAIDIDKYRYDPQIRKKYREELELGEKKTMIHVGRLHPAKNHMFLLEVFAQVVKQNPNTVLLLVGDGELRDEIQKKISALGLQDCVQMLGSRSDVPQLLQAADFFVFPSAWEGLPVTLVEAQAAGLPCFISDQITKEVVLSDLVTCLPIDHGVDCWTKQLTNANASRRDVAGQIQEKGYDIRESARWLADFYEGLAAEDSGN